MSVEYGSLSDRAGSLRVQSEQLRDENKQVIQSWYGLSFQAIEQVPSDRLGQEVSYKQLEDLIPRHSLGEAQGWLMSQFTNSHNISVDYVSREDRNLILLHIKHQITPWRISTVMLHAKTDDLRTRYWMEVHRMSRFEVEYTPVSADEFNDSEKVSELDLAQIAGETIVAYAQVVSS